MPKEFLIWSNKSLKGSIKIFPCTCGHEKTVKKYAISFNIRHTKKNNAMVKIKCKFCRKKVNKKNVISLVIHKKYIINFNI